jgi:hypothetical protein
MKREQIIKILSKELQDGNIEMCHINIEQLAEKLALPLNVPSDDELEKTLWEEIAIPLSEKDSENNTDAYKQYKETFLWMRWVRDEIIKRNK